MGFSVLVPDYVSTAPAHASDAVSVALVSGADLSITGVDRLGNDTEIYSDTAVTSSDDFCAWNLSVSTAYVMIDSGSY